MYLKHCHVSVILFIQDQIITGSFIFYEHELSNDHLAIKWNDSGTVWFLTGSVTSPPCCALHCMQLLQVYEELHTVECFSKGHNSYNIFLSKLKHSLWSRCCCMLDILVLEVVFLQRFLLMMMVKLS